MREVRAVIVALQQVLANQVVILNEMSNLRNSTHVRLAMDNSKDIAELLHEESQLLAAKMERDESTLAVVSDNSANISQSAE